jgi:hypothetical protein
MLGVACWQLVQKIIWGDIVMDKIVQDIQAVREQPALSDVFDDFITGDVICGTLRGM